MIHQMVHKCLCNIKHKPVLKKCVLYTRNIGQGALNNSLESLRDDFLCILGLYSMISMFLYNTNPCVSFCVSKANYKQGGNGMDIRRRLQEMKDMREKELARHLNYLRRLKERHERGEI